MNNDAQLQEDIAACARGDYEVMNKFREAAEAERDELAAHVERLKEAMIEACNTPVSVSQHSSEAEELQVIYDILGTALAGAPKTSLTALKAKWQAHALRSAAMDLGTSSAALFLAARANQIERQ